MRTPNQPNIVVMYVIVGIVAIVIFSFVVITLVILMLRRKAPRCHQLEPPSGLPAALTPVKSGRAEQDCKLLASHLGLYTGQGSGGSGPASSGEGSGSPDIFDYLPSTRDCYVRGYQPSPSRLSPSALCSALEPAARREEGDGAEVRPPEPLYAESSKRRFCPSSLIEAEYCRGQAGSSLRPVAPPALPPDLVGGGAEGGRARSCTTV
jgi:hypothetical protein